MNINSKKFVFDISVFQYIKDTFYDDKNTCIKNWIMKDIILKNKKIYSTNFIKNTINEQLGSVSMVFDDILDCDDNININNNDNSIIKFFNLKNFENDVNYILISNNFLLRENIKKIGFEAYSIDDFINFICNT